MTANINDIDNKILDRLKNDIRRLAVKYKYIHNIDIDFDDFSDEEYDMKKYIDLFYDYYPKELYVYIGQCKILCDEIDEESCYYRNEEIEFGLRYQDYIALGYDMFLQDLENKIIEYNKLITYF